MEIERLSARVEMDIRDAETKATKLDKTLDKAAKDRTAILRVETDDTKIKSIEAQFDELGRDRKAEIKVSTNEAKIVKTKAQIKALGEDQDVNVNIVVDRGSMALVNDQIQEIALNDDVHINIVADPQSLIYIGEEIDAVSRDRNAFITIVANEQKLTVVAAEIDEISKDRIADIQIVTDETKLAALAAEIDAFSHDRKIKITADQSALDKLQADITKIGLLRNSQIRLAELAPKLYNQQNEPEYLRSKIYNQQDEQILRVVPKVDKSRLIIVNHELNELAKTRTANVWPMFGKGSGYLQERDVNERGFGIGRLPLGSPRLNSEANYQEIPDTPHSIRGRTSTVRLFEREFEKMKGSSKEEFEKWVDKPFKLKVATETDGADSMMNEILHGKGNTKRTVKMKISSVFAEGENFLRNIFHRKENSSDFNRNMPGIGELASGGGDIGKLMTEGATGGGEFSKAMTSVGSSISSALPMLGLMLIGMMLLGPAIIAVGGAAIGLIAGLSPLVGLLAALPALFAGIAMGGIVLMGMVKTVTAAFTGYSNSVENAIQLNMAYKDSQRNAAQADIGFARATREMANARRDAAEAIKQASLAARSSSLGEERATLSLEQAYKTLKDVQGGLAGSSTEITKVVDDFTGKTFDVERTTSAAAQNILDQNDKLKDAILNVKEAELGVAQAQDTKLNNEQTYQELYQKGIEKSDIVIDRTQALADATAAVATAQFAMNKAFEDAQGGKDYLKLGDASKQLVKDLQDAKTNFEKSGRDALEAASPSLSAFVSQLDTFMTNLSPSLTNLGGSFGGFVDSLTTLLKDPNFSSNFKTIIDSMANNIVKIGPGIADFASSLATISAAAKPLFDYIADKIVEAGAGFKKTTEDASASGALDKGFQLTIATMEVVGKIIGKLFTSFSGLMKAGQPFGEWFLNDILKTLTGWDTFINSAEGQTAIEAFFERIKPTLLTIKGFIGDIAGAFETAFGSDQAQKNFSGVINKMRDDIPGVLNVFQKLSDLMPAISATLTVISPILQIIGFAMQGLTYLAGMLGTVLNAFIDILNKVLPDSWALPKIPQASIDAMLPPELRSGYGIKPPATEISKGPGGIITRTIGKDQQTRMWDGVWVNDNMVPTYLIYNPPPANRKGNGLYQGTDAEFAAEQIRLSTAPAVIPGQNPIYGGGGVSGTTTGPGVPGTYLPTTTDPNLPPFWNTPIGNAAVNGVTPAAAAANQALPALNTSYGGGGMPRNPGPLPQVSTAYGGGGMPNNPGPLVWIENQYNADVPTAQAMSDQLVWDLKSTTVGTKDFVSGGVRRN